MPPFDSPARDVCGLADFHFVIGDGCVMSGAIRGEPEELDAPDDPMCVVDVVASDDYVEIRTWLGW